MGTPPAAPPPGLTLVLPLEVLDLLVELDQHLGVLLLQELQTLLQVQDPLLRLAVPSLRAVLSGVLEDCGRAGARAQCVPGAREPRAGGPPPGRRHPGAHVAAAAAAARPLGGWAAQAWRRVAMETGASEGAWRARGVAGPTEGRGWLWGRGLRQVPPQLEYPDLKGIL